MHTNFPISAKKHNKAIREGHRKAAHLNCDVSIFKQIHTQMNTAFKKEVNNFRLWAKECLKKPRAAEWECEYKNWHKLRPVFADFISTKKISDLSSSEIVDIMYIIARDNEMEEIIEDLATNKKLFEQLLFYILDSNDNDINTLVKFQFTRVLGDGTFNNVMAEKALLLLVEDSYEYTRRIALLALGKLNSIHTEFFCKKAWDSNHEYQRIMVLWTLKEIESEKLSKYLQLAKEDGRKYLVKNANDIMVAKK